MTNKEKNVNEPIEELKLAIVIDNTVKSLQEIKDKKNTPISVVVELEEIQKNLLEDRPSISYR